MTSEPHDLPEPLMTLWPSPARRWMAVGLLAILGALLLLLALEPGASGLARLVLALVGAAVLVGADAMRRATQTGVVLSEAGLHDTTGRLMAAIHDIRRVDRGFMVFKPAGGFVVSLTSKSRFAWVPGVWWRMGRSMGIGGVTSAPQARAMAEMLAARISSD